MDEIKFKKIKKTNIINASEIGQYEFCSISWYLQKLGFKPKSELLEKGSIKHRQLGYVIDRNEKNIKISILFKIIGFIFFLFMVIILLFEVLL